MCCKDDISQWWARSVGFSKLAAAQPLRGHLETLTEKWKWKATSLHCQDWLHLLEPLGYPFPSTEFKNVLHYKHILSQVVWIFCNILVLINKMVFFLEEIWFDFSFMTSNIWHSFPMPFLKFQPPWHHLPWLHTHKWVGVAAILFFFLRDFWQVKICFYLLVLV